MGYSKNFNLNSLNGNNGFLINGLEPEGFLGTSASSAGDVNGDGIDDVIMGAPHVDHGEPTVALGTGQAYVIFGGNSFSSSFDLSTLNGENGFVINGIGLNMLGFSVNGAGDINGDGKDDIIVGAPYSSPNNLINAGQAYVIFGTNSFPSSFNVSTLNGSNGFTINGLTAGDWLGYSVSGLGDVNGDNKADFIISGPYSSSNGVNSGQAYVIFGANSFSSPLDLNTLNGNNGFLINGLTSGNKLGYSVSGFGDVNNDDKHDIIIGAPYGSANGVNSGQAYVIFGADSFQSSFNLNNLNGNNGFYINGITPNSTLGSSVNIGGDVNGDGIDDMIIGADNASPNGQDTAGQAYVVFGKNIFSSSFDLNTLNGNNGFTLNGLQATSMFGTPVSIFGDFNNDGKHDMIAGAVHANPEEITHAGQAYVIFGASSFKTPFNVSELNGNNGFTISGSQEHDALGWAVGGVDINGDGRTDIIVSSVDATTNSDDMMMDDMMGKQGQVYTIFNEQSSSSSSNSLSPGEIAGAVIGSIGGAALLTFGALFYCKTNHLWPFAVATSGLLGKTLAFDDNIDSNWDNLQLHGEVETAIDH